MKRPGKKKIGAPREWSDERLSQLFADVEFLKKTTGESARDICEKLARKEKYSVRWGRQGAAGLRKAYAEANKRRRGLLFQFVLGGVEATIPANGIDIVEAAIERHALKV
jgi:hypothetical protein